MAFFYSRRFKEKKTEEYRLGYLVDGRYNGKSEGVVLTFYDPKTNELFNWYDVTGHLSYLLTDAPIDVIKTLFEGRYANIEEVLKYDSINDKAIKVRKVYAKDPQTIGGNTSSSFRSILMEEGYSVWEAWIRYHNCYCYDNLLEYGMPYLVFRSRISPYFTAFISQRIQKVESVIKQSVPLNESLKHFIRLFETDFPKIKACAVDIEVRPSDSHVPDAKAAEQPIICVSIVGTDGKKTILVLNRQEIERQDFSISGATIIYFDSELQLISETFKYMMQYPFIITFNGDAFDFTYLHNRAEKLGISKYSNPIYVHENSNETSIRNSIHIDIYLFLKNPSIQNYAFKGDYKHFKLNDIAKALLKKSKIENDKPIPQLSYEELTRYCLNDAELTLELTTFNNSIVMNLIFTICRMANLTVSQVCRSQISTWTQSTFYYFHRMRNIIIPTSDELMAKGSAQTGATIKGKKYRGAIVRDPKPGARFNVIVMDVGSLYPSEIKERNICYSTVNCHHAICKSNIVPDTTHHICTVRQGITSEIIGALRDTRVLYYKGQAKSNSDPLMRSFYSVFEQAIKVYINAAYGVFGSEFFALYTPVVAEIVTAYGRRDITIIAEHAIKMGIDIIAGDTDSIILNNPTIEQTNLLQKWARDNLSLDIGVDKVYKVAFFTNRKKNYLGIYADGKMDIKGLVGKKSNVPILIRNAFDEIGKIMSAINKEEDIEISKVKILALAKKYYKRIKDYDFTLKEVAFSTTLGKDVDDYNSNVQHVVAAKELIDMGYDISSGDVVEYVKAITPSGIMPIQNGDKSKVDIQTYVEQYKTMLDQILEPLGINFEEDIMDGPKQKKLGYFFE